MHPPEKSFGLMAIFINLTLDVAVTHKMNLHSVKLSTYTGYMFLIGEVKIVHFVLERVQDLSMSGHISS